MEINPLFYAWLPKYVRLAILFLMLFVVLCANGVYLGITTNMYSDLGVYLEPYTMATNAMYIGMAAGMIFKTTTSFAHQIFPDPAKRLRCDAEIGCYVRQRNPERNIGLGI